MLNSRHSHDSAIHIESCDTKWSLRDRIVHLSVHHLGHISLRIRPETLRHSLFYKFSILLFSIFEKLRFYYSSYDSILTK